MDKTAKTIAAALESVPLGEPCVFVFLSQNVFCIATRPSQPDFPQIQILCNIGHRFPINSLECTRRQQILTSVLPQDEKHVPKNSEKLMAIKSLVATIV
jgi:hypothetical protein